MAITMYYECSECRFHTNLLDGAQNHADRTQHTINIHGAMTSRKPVVDRERIEVSAAEKARKEMIMREARKRGVGPFAAQR